MQSNLAKTALGIGLVAVTVVLFVVLSDSGDGEMRESTTVAPSGATGGGKPQSQQPQEAEQPPKPPKPAVPTVTVRGGGPVGGVEEIDVVSGDRVRFKVVSDEAGEIHIHGYEITEPVKAGGTVTLDFPADLQGGYEIELHGQTGEFQIADLVVNPG